MSARFTKIPRTDPVGRRWALFFHAGTDWVLTWQLIVNTRDKEKLIVTAPSPFYVDSHIIHFCLELFTKSLIDYSNPNFDSKEFSHRTLDYINKYVNVSPIFAKISADKALSKLIREYEKTIDTRYAETFVQIEQGDVEKMMSLVYEMRKEMCEKTGLR